jgi:hypothetical protein
MSRESRMLAEILLVVLWRAGHAHAGVYLVLSLVMLRYVDEAALSLDVARQNWRADRSDSDPSRVPALRGLADCEGAERVEESRLHRRSVSGCRGFVPWSGPDSRCAAHRTMTRIRALYSECVDVILRMRRFEAAPVQRLTSPLSACMAKRELSAAFALPIAWISSRVIDDAIDPKGVIWLSSYGNDSTAPIHRCTNHEALIITSTRLGCPLAIPASIVGAMSAARSTRAAGTPIDCARCT